MGNMDWIWVLIVPVKLQEMLEVKHALICSHGHNEVGGVAHLTEIQ